MSKKCVCGNEMTREDWKHEWVCHRCGRKRPIPLMTNLEAVIVIAMVKNNLNVTAVANTLPMQRNTVLYHLDKIERETKLNPRHIHDLIDLLEIALEVL